ncbi:MAG: UvrD-helicase domain-containing protein, partial [Trueperaceae bacterium]|nr:UvrD-helicase domain-containing protein [Trueperaceae bacterium]
MPDSFDQDRIERLLEGLNAPQREAVVHGDGPLLILAGAGSGKTRVLTHRVAHLIHTRRARAGEILAITFTNKAAQEMRERVEALMGRRTRAMWLMTFHAACTRMLRAEAPRLGYTRQFTIYDQADARRLLKQCLDDLGVDTKRFTPNAILHQISDAKNKLRDADTYRRMVDGYFEQTVADAFDLYERELLRMNAMDFDDLLVRAVNVLELFQEVRDRYATAFRHVLVDEYQDTNHAQYRWLQLLTSEEPRNLAVVGDDDQCLVEGTRITMGDGSTRPIEKVHEGDDVLSCYGSGDFRPARVQRAFSSHRTDGIAITLRSGRTIVSTPEHTHFAGFKLGVTPQQHMTYLMWKQGVGCRVGTTRTYTDAQKKARIGVIQRSVQEHADGAWVVSAHDREGDARAEEAVLALRFGVPTLPFVARKSTSVNTLVGEQALLDRVFASVDSEKGGLALLSAAGLDACQPHHRAQSYIGRRRNVVVTLCGDRRGRRPMHRLSLFGYDDEGRKALEDLGLSVRPARRGSRGWRYESCFANTGAALDLAERICDRLDGTLHCVARFGRNDPGRPSGNSLPFRTAGNIRPGMAMFDGTGGYDVVDSVERVTINRPVYDIDVEGTHNFVAEGIVTHNSVYGFRGADVTNILNFQDHYPDAHVVRLEQNYRSTQSILDAANAVISHNRGRMSKSLWTDLGTGEPLRLRELDDEHAEARYVVGEIERLLDEEGVARSEVAVFYRTNAQSRVLEDTLVRRELAYQVIGGTKFYERAEIKDAIAYLTVLANPADAICFQRIVSSPRRGIGQTSLQRVLSHAQTTDVAVWDAASDPSSVPGLGSAAVRAIGRFMDTMAGLRRRAEGGGPVADLLEAVLGETRYLEALENERTIEARGRIENLEELVEVTREHDATNDGDDAGLDAFLSQISLVADADTRRDDDGMVTLMTLHNAKGLEYPVVFILGCEEGVFPHSRALDEGGLEEERRLAYVG